MTSIVFLLDNCTSQVAQLVKNLPCNVGDPGSIPGLGSTPGEGLACPLMFLGFLGGSDGKGSTYNAGDFKNIFIG